MNLDFQLVHNGKNWELEIWSYDLKLASEGSVTIPVSDSEARQLQAIGVRVWSA